MPRVLLLPEILSAALSGEEFDLDAETAKKLTRVLRLAPGETFVGFDGQGREWECVLTTTGQPREEDEFATRPRKGKARARALLLEERVAPEQPRLHLSVAQAVPKSDKMEWVLQKGTELGVAEFWPFESERTVTRLLSSDDEAERASARGQRWRRIVAAAAGQCGRANVPVVHAVSDLATVLGAGIAQGRCFLLDESAAAEPLKAALEREPIKAQDDIPGKAMLLIGPEGGWTAQEREQAERYGAEPVHLGRLILRTETAALVGATLLLWEAGELD